MHGSCEIIMASLDLPPVFTQHHLGILPLELILSHGNAILSARHIYAAMICRGQPTDVSTPSPALLCILALG